MLPLQRLTTKGHDTSACLLHVCVAPMLVPAGGRPTLLGLLQHPWDSPVRSSHSTAMSTPSIAVLPLIVSVAQVGGWGHVSLAEVVRHLKGLAEVYCMTWRGSQSTLHDMEVLAEVLQRPEGCPPFLVRGFTPRPVTKAHPADAHQSLMVRLEPLSLTLTYILDHTVAVTWHPRTTAVVQPSPETSM